MNSFKIYVFTDFLLESYINPAFQACHSFSTRRSLHNFYQTFRATTTEIRKEVQLKINMGDNVN
jgi:hypothetical protein